MNASIIWTAHNLDHFALPESQKEVHDEGKENRPGNIQASEIQVETEPVVAEEFPELDDETLELLDDDGGLDKYKNFVFHPKLANSWEKILTAGLKKEKKAELLEKYPRNGNCPIGTPKLNPEIEVSLNETSKKRDKFFVADLDLCGASLSALGAGISMIFSSSVQELDGKELLTTLADAGKLICELHGQLIKARKAFIYPNLDKKAKAVLEKSETGEFLFGQELAHRIKSAKAVEKLSLTLKPQGVEKKPPLFRASALNWRGSSARGRGPSQAGCRNVGQRHYQSQEARGRGRPLSQGRFQSGQSQDRPVNPSTAKK